MNHRPDDPSKKPGYPEEQPKRHDGSESHPSPDTPHQPQNTPDRKPKPSS